MTSYNDCTNSNVSTRYREIQFRVGLQKRSLESKSKASDKSVRPTRVISIAAAKKPLFRLDGHRRLPAKYSEFHTTLLGLQALLKRVGCDRLRARIRRCRTG